MQATGLAPVRQAEIAHYLHEVRRDLHLPGLSIAVVQGGRMVYARGLGMACSGHAMTAQTPLIIGSLSKGITALAVMQLVEVGKLDLDAPVQQYLPWFRLADPEGSARLTLRHLLTHTSGISGYDGQACVAGRSEQTIEQRVRRLCTLKLARPVGTAFEYSNLNYIIAGLLVEVVSGEAFGSYLHQHLFIPLGMHHGATTEEEAMRGGLACGYRWWFGLPVPYPARYRQDALPAGFVAASAEDLARYALALLGGGTLEGASVLSPASVAELLRPQVAAAPGSFYGLGWRVETLDGVAVRRHAGAVSNYHTELVLVPDLALGVVVMLNAGNGLLSGQASRLASGVVQLLVSQSRPAGGLSLWGVYVLVDAVLLALSGYQIWSVGALLRSGSARRRPVLSQAALCEVGLAAAAARWMPRLLDAPWSLLRVYVPDLTCWLGAFFGCSLLKCLVLLGGVLRSRSQSGMRCTSSTPITGMVGIFVRTSIAQPKTKRFG